MSTEDIERVESNCQKPSVQRIVNQSLTRDLLVDANGEQLIVGSRPRESLSVAICADGNVADGELEGALEDVLDEYRHLRAIAGHGFDAIEDVESLPLEAAVPLENVDVDDLLEAAIAKADGKVAFHLRQAAQLRLVDDDLDRGDGIETDGGRQVALDGQNLAESEIDGPVRSDEPTKNNVKEAFGVVGTPRSVLIEEFETLGEIEDASRVKLVRLDGIGHSTVDKIEEADDLYQEGDGGYLIPDGGSDLPGSPDDRQIDDISAVERCDSCGWEPAAVILVDGEWECYNCGHDPDDPGEIVTDGGRPGGTGRNQLDQQIGSLLEAWINRDVPSDRCRFCNEPLDDSEPPAARYCDESCEEAFDQVLEARLAIGRRDLDQRGFD